MKKISTALILGALTLVSGSAMAWGHVGVQIGVPIGPYYPGPYYSPYYYPPVVVQPAAVPVYVEQPTVPTQAAAPVNYWYYCAAAKGYYPYVKECTGGWQKVSPQPVQP